MPKNASASLQYYHERVQSILKHFYPFSESLVGFSELFFTFELHSCIPKWPIGKYCFSFLVNKWLCFSRDGSLCFPVLCIFISVYARWAYHGKSWQPLRSHLHETLMVLWMSRSDTEPEYLVPATLVSKWRKAKLVTHKTTLTSTHRLMSLLFRQKLLYQTIGFHKGP